MGWNIFEQKLKNHEMYNGFDSPRTKRAIFACGSKLKLSVVKCNSGPPFAVRQRWHIFCVPSIYDGNVGDWSDSIRFTFASGQTVSCQCILSRTWPRLFERCCAQKHFACRRFWSRLLQPLPTWDIFYCIRSWAASVWLTPARISAISRLSLAVAGYIIGHVCFIV